MHGWGGFLWAWPIILGPILLGGALYYGVMLRRRPSVSQMPGHGEHQAPVDTTTYLVRLGVIVGGGLIFVWLLASFGTGAPY